MHWKTIKGKEYLYKYRDRHGNGGSLGPRSPATERLFQEFERERREFAALRDSRREALATATRFCRAALIHRVPEPVIRILRGLEQDGLAAGSVMVIDTHALSAYEFTAGVFIDAPKDSPFRAEAGQRLTLGAVTPVPPDNFMRLLRQADRSFQALPGNGFEAVNQAGFVVRLVRPQAVRAATKIGNHPAQGPTVPAESGDLGALFNSPRFSQVVIGKRGAPATMVAPDPRAMALHKLWLSQQEDRAPSLKQWDRVQAMALAELIVGYLPQYDFFSADLNLFPADVIRKSRNLVEGYEMLPALEFD
jgi:hypothetical protein